MLRTHTERGNRMKWVTAEIVLGDDGWYGLIFHMDGNRSRKYESLTRDYRRLQNFARRINEGRVHPIHIDDVVEDFLD